jgi:hypothetical protein
MRDPQQVFQRHVRQLPHFLQTRFWCRVWVRFRVEMEKVLRLCLGETDEPAPAFVEGVEEGDESAGLVFDGRA